MLARMLELRAPLAFSPVYQELVWGGRRMAAWREDLPAGRIGESWDIADHPRGMSVVSGGPWHGVSLRELMARAGRQLVGGSWSGGEFPLMVKLLDASDRLSVQVHPDDRLAASLGAGPRGKTECWLLLADGGELFVGTRPGTTRVAFEQALDAGRIESVLERHRACDGDFFFLPARTVHALGAGCLLYEVQQTCDITFRMHDWGRVGADGRPRALHREHSLATIDFAAGGGPVQARTSEHPLGGSVRALADCPYFQVEERRAGHTQDGGGGRCAVVVCLSGHGRLATAGGEERLLPMRSLLVPAAAGPWSATADAGSALRLLVARPS
jgi:mannose-6-phosphate isomerase